MQRGVRRTAQPQAVRAPSNYLQRREMNLERKPSVLTHDTFSSSARVERVKNRLSGRVCAATFGRASSIVIRVLVRPHNRCRWFGNTVNMKKQITVRSIRRPGAGRPHMFLYSDSCRAVGP